MTQLRKVKEAIHLEAEVQRAKVVLSTSQDKTHGTAQ